MLKIKKEELIKALTDCNYHRKNASILLGVSERSIYNLCKKHGVNLHREKKKVNYRKKKETSYGTVWPTNKYRIKYRDEMSSRDKL